ncbi:hypothetical protein NL30_37280 [Burkholderia contaminans]|nr:hypothetical protein NL30_37280 [Burkholderia contaminans]
MRLFMPRGLVCSISILFFHGLCLTLQIDQLFLGRRKFFYFFRVMPIGRFLEVILDLLTHTSTANERFGNIISHHIFRCKRQLSTFYFCQPTGNFLQFSRKFLYVRFMYRLAT